MLLTTEYYYVHRLFPHVYHFKISTSVYTYATTTRSETTLARYSNNVYSLNRELKPKYKMSYLVIAALSSKYRSSLNTYVAQHVISI